MHENTHDDQNCTTAMCTSVANCHLVERSDAAVDTFCVKNFQFNIFGHYRLRARLINSFSPIELHEETRINTDWILIARLIIKLSNRMGFFFSYIL